MFRKRYREAWKPVTSIRSSYVRNGRLEGTMETGALSLSPDVFLCSHYVFEGTRSSGGTLPGQNRQTKVQQRQSKGDEKQGCGVE